MTKEELFWDILHYGIPKAEVSIQDRTGKYFRVRNWLFNGKVYFTVQVDGKIICVMDICGHS